MARKNLPDARNRILRAALKVFAEKSYEGSRIEEIAREANVPKSVIYYHFQSKEDMLKVLLGQFLEDYLKLIEVAEHDSHQVKADSLPDRIHDRYASFERNHADLLRVLLIESLKKSNQEPVVFKIVEALIEKEISFNTINNSPGYDREERLVAEFFTNLIPNYAFVCFRESWLNHFKMDGSRLDELFTRVFLASHGAYHRYHD